MPELPAPEEPRDRPFNPFRQPRTDNVQTVVADIINQVQNYERHFDLRTRKRRPADQATFEAVVTAIVCDLIHRELTQPEGWLAVSLSKQVLGKKSRYGSSVMSKTLPVILERLAAPEMAFVEMNKGYQGFAETFGPGRQTTIRAGRKLLIRIKENDVGLADLKVSGTEEVIILKSSKADYWDKKTSVDYEDTPTTNAFRDEVNTINAWLDAADITFDGFYRGAKPVDENDRRLRRNFCNGSFDHGGRLFGGFWQQISKKQRKQGILINGEEVVTLDYGQMAPRILYGLAGQVPPQQDAYLLPGYEDKRPGVKKIFNALLFADKPLKRMPSGTRKYFQRRISIQDVFGQINQIHYPVQHLFYTGIGYNIQFRESEILIDVLLALRKRDIVALPIFDAVVVAKSQVTLVSELMIAIFKEHTEVDGIVDIEEGK